LAKDNGLSDGQAVVLQLLSRGCEHVD